MTSVPRQPSPPILRETSSILINRQPATMSSGPDISHFNALGLSVSGDYSGPSIPTRDGRLRNDSPLSTISSSTL